MNVRRALAPILWVFILPLGVGGEERAVQRRQFIGWAVAAAAGSAAGSAEAFRLMAPDGRTRALMERACTPAGRGDSAYHARLISELRGALEAQGLLVDQNAYDRLVAAAACPLCGCRLSAGLNLPGAPRV